jgi:hypothetical protein
MKTGIIAQQSGKENPTNIISNGDFENWSAGIAVAPDGWSLISATTARSTTHKSGSYGCEVTADGSDAFHGAYYAISNFSDYKGEYVSASVWVYQSSGVAQTCTLRIYDGVGATNFEKSIPNTTWTQITGSVLVDASAAALWIVVLPTTGSSQTSSNIAVFDKVQLNRGESAFAFSDKPIVYSDSRYKLVAYTRVMSVGSGNVSYTGAGFAPKGFEVIANVDGTVANCQGFYGGSVGGVIETNQAGLKYAANTYVISLTPTTGGNAGSATVVSLDADGVTLAWTKSGSPTETINFYIMYYR